MKVVATPLPIHRPEARITSYGRFKGRNITAIQLMGSSIRDGIVWDLFSEVSLERAGELLRICLSPDGSGNLPRHLLSIENTPATGVKEQYVNRCKACANAAFGR